MPRSPRESHEVPSTRHARTASPAAPRHARTIKNHTVLRSVALTATAVVAFGASGIGFAAAQFHGNITTVGSLNGLVAPPSEGATAAPTAIDPNAGRAINIVAIGSDSRSGANAAIGGADPGQRSDTTMVIHISADRSRVEVVSIPRDSLVNIPACHLDHSPTGKMSKPQTRVMFNSAFSIGASTGDTGLAAACTMSTIQTMTGLTIDDFALVDFEGFQQMVTAIGGVRVCVPKPLVDGVYTNLDLSAGWHDLTGPQALDYVRARHVKGSDGSDLERIERQKSFVGALVRKVTSSSVLSSPVSITQFLDAATKSLTTSTSLADIKNLVGLAWNLRHLTPSQVQFVTVPVGPAPSDPNRVQWTAKATELWNKLRNDQSLEDASATTAPTGTTATPAGTPAGGSTPATPVATPDPTPSSDFALTTGIQAPAAACG
jgi:LCP family protein required for cell wall assembly